MLARAVLAIVLVTAAAAHAQPGQDRSPVDRIADAAGAVDDKDWERVIVLVGDIPNDAAVTPADHAEAHRLLGIAEFYRQRYDSAEAHFHAYLRIELDGHLDIGLFAPDVVTFFDNVKAKHAAELRALRPRTRRWAVLNLVPPAGQFQNRQRAKGWVLGGLGATLLATNITTYVMLDRWCSDLDRTCEDGSRSRADSARRMKTINSITGAALVGLYVYGVIDGFRHYRRARATVTVTPVSMGARGGGIGIAGTF
ncbi:MAG: hypothetical protein K8M05_13845 [Deltaproteobacteria bacterium]|nr:hypothetical protein [Kofleriaceae bacterium]